MAGKKREDVREEDVTGLKYFDKLAPLLARLHDVGCQRDKAGNRTLHFDQYCMLVQHTSTLVDGTLLKGLPVLLQAAMPDPRAARFKAKFKLFNEIVTAPSSYVCRLRDNSRYEIEEQRALCDEDVEAGVRLDAVVQMGDTSKADARPDHPIRLVVVRATPHEKRGGSAGPASNGQLRIATKLLDLPAWIIALIYRCRWTIEIFFRFFKHVPGCRHLLSHDPVGIEIQTYCAIIACMLISLWTGRKPTLRTQEMICHYFTGLAEEDELPAHLAKLQKQDAST